MIEYAAKLNWEGIISKRADAPYRSERNENWLKIKVHTGKFPVVGFVKDPTGVAALYLGKQKGKDLVYMGKVGTGWSRTISSQIRKQLDTVVSPKSKLTRPIRKPKATWVEPKFYADVEYGDSRRDCYVPVRSKGFRGMINPDCPVCFGLGWVCENHPQRAWSEDVGCQCGAGMPCECVSADGLEKPDVSQILEAPSTLH